MRTVCRFCGFSQSNEKNCPICIAWQHDQAIRDAQVVQDDIGDFPTINDVIVNAYDDKYWLETFPVDHLTV